MSVQNGERLIRFLRSDSRLREKVKDAGWEKFQDVTAEAGASCTTYEVVAALIREIENDS